MGQHSQYSDEAMNWLSKILWCSSTCVRDFSLLQNIQKSYGPTQPPMQQIMAVKWLGNEEHHSNPNSTEVNEWNYTSVTPTRLHGMQRDNITFTSHQWEVKSATAHINSAIWWAWVIKMECWQTPSWKHPSHPSSLPLRFPFFSISRRAVCQHTHYFNRKECP